MRNAELGHDRKRHTAPRALKGRYILPVPGTGTRRVGEERDQSMSSTLIYSPEGHTDALLERTPRTSIKKLAGLRIGVLDNGKAGADHLLGRMGAELAKKTGGIYVGCFRKQTAATPCETELIDRLAKEVEVVLTGTAD